MRRKSHQRVVVLLRMGWHSVRMIFAAALASEQALEKFVWSANGNANRPAAAPTILRGGEDATGVQVDRLAFLRTL
jgi:hypothetical protein